ncbi:hypothetical protein NLU13_6397 [Sarocladium strictum]|uniref:Asl1-like glycosyl hydrolase catalytic domain-containing protein n=1 Tax=Sarocladium strictum TaxID=5046 RepID=A0AA39GI82_SARSR|nr:hypothetical protein NLU13_6397 [Sarocladium strictum]
MMNSKLALFTAAAVLAQQVSGLSAHHHLHALEKRALEAEKRVAELEARGVVVETVWEYVTTTIKWSPGMPAPEATAQPAPAPVAAEAVPAAPAAVPTTFAKVVVPASAPAPAPAPASAPAAAPAPAPVASAPVSQPQEQTQQAKPQQSNSNSNQGSSSTGAPFSSKRGIAYNDASLANTFGSECSACSWGYSWSSRRDGNFDSKYSFVPMLWGPAPDKSANWQQDATDGIAQGAKALFSFNEPDIVSQSNLSPAQAAQDFQTFMNPFSGKALIGAPAVSNSNLAGQGLDWLQQFVTTCNGLCKYDFCNLHWYDYAAAADSLFDHLEKAHKICGGKPIWLTEFAPLDGPGDATNGFIAQVIPKLDQLEYLDAYSYFMVSQDHLMSGSGLSAAGQAYASAA